MRKIDLPSALAILTMALSRLAGKAIADRDGAEFLRNPNVHAAYLGGDLTHH